MNKLITIVAFIFGLIAATAVFQGYQYSIDMGTSQSNAQIIRPSDTAQKQRILYVSDVTGNQEIYEMDLDTKKAINLTNNPANDMNPQVSPDNKYIVFYSNRDGDNEIYRMKLDDGSVKQLTKNAIQDYDPIYSPDGKTIAYKSNADDQKGDIFIMQSDGSKRINITPDRADTEEWDPVFTPDGKSLFFVIRKNSIDDTDELARAQIDGSEFKQITSNTIPDWYPAIHPSLDKILYISKTDAKNPDDIYTSTLDGDERTQITSLPGNDADPAWNIAGDKIIFINDQDGDYDLYQMNIDGSNPEKIIDTDSTELSPVYLAL